MNTVTKPDRSTLRLREAWQLHELGFFEAAVMTARVAIEQACVERIGESSLADNLSVRQLTGRLQQTGRLSNTKRKRIHDLYSPLNPVCHGRTVDERRAYDLIVMAGMARDLVAGATAVQSSGRLV